MKWIINYIVGIITFLFVSIGLVAMGALLAVLSPIITLFILDD